MQETQEALELDQPCILASCILRTAPEPNPRAIIPPPGVHPRCRCRYCLLLPATAWCSHHSPHGPGHPGHSSIPLARSQLTLTSLASSRASSAITQSFIHTSLSSHPYPYRQRPPTSSRFTSTTNSALACSFRANPFKPSIPLIPYLRSLPPPSSHLPSPLFPRPPSAPEL